ncbi:MAG: carbon storage regulator CsrA [Acidimicrobiaceae bacterium]|nr:carbon storage regulator CsrA [Acidimicrobiaceae bacterium]
MLVLTRRANQSIVIGKDIVITILDVHRDQVRIGIKAPRDVDVHRLEVFEALEKANQEAAISDGDLLITAEGQEEPAPTVEEKKSAS